MSSEPSEQLLFFFLTQLKRQRAFKRVFQAIALWHSSWYIAAGVLADKILMHPLRMSKGMSVVQDATR